MYQSFFQFSQLPFQITPNPHFFFLSKHHEEALSHLTFGIQERRGFILITGEIGTGKTTLCRLILDRLGPSVKTSLIFNPNLSTLELLQSINQDFGLPGTSSSKKELVDELNGFLLRELEGGGNAVLIIDEAQNLPIQCLEEVRMLSNLETQNDKLIQIVLMGQPELREKLELPELRQLNQRIALRHHLLPLSESEVKVYIQFRLKMAHGEERTFFTPEAIRKIYGYSQGVPRLVNILCDKALLAAFVADSHVISKKVVTQAIRELNGYRENRITNLKKNRFKHGLRQFNPKRGVVHAAYTVIIFLLIASIFFVLGNFSPWKEREILGEKATVKTVSSLGMGGETGVLTELPVPPGIFKEKKQTSLKPHNPLQSFPFLGASRRANLNELKSARFEEPVFSPGFFQPLSPPQSPPFLEASKGGNKNPVGSTALEDFPQLTEGFSINILQTTVSDSTTLQEREEVVSLGNRGMVETKKRAAVPLISLWDPWFERQGIDRWIRQDDLDFKSFVQDRGFVEMPIPMNRENLFRFDSPLLFELEETSENRKNWVLLREIHGPTATVWDPLSEDRKFSLEQLEPIWGEEGTLLWKPLDGLTFPMALGSKGSGVQRLQDLLKGNGFFEGEIDGIFGSLTFEGVVRLQKHLGIEENGYFDAETAFFLTRLTLGSQIPSLKGGSFLPSNL